MRAKSIKQIKSEIRELAAIVWPEHTTGLRVCVGSANSYSHIAAIDEEGNACKVLTDTMPTRELHAYLRGLQRGLNNIR